MRKKLVSLLFFGCSVFYSYCQPGMFNRTYEFGGYDVGFASIEFDSGYLVLGSSLDLSFTYANLFLLFTDFEGDTIKTKLFGTKDYDSYPSSIIRGGDGKYYVSGYVYSNNTGIPRAAFFKFSPEGDSLIFQLYGDSLQESAINRIIQTQDGGFIMLGGMNQINPPDSNLYDVLLIKIDSIGQVQWENTVEQTGWQAGMDIVQSENGGYYVSGFTRNSGAQDLYLMKLDSTGGKIWQRNYGGPLEDFG